MAGTAGFHLPRMTGRSLRLGLFLPPRIAHQTHPTRFARRTP